MADIVATSGTTGCPIQFFLTARDIERLAENERQSFLCAGVRSGETYHLAVSLDNMFVAGLAYFSGLVRMGPRPSGRDRGTPPPRPSSQGHPAGGDRLRAFLHAGAGPGRGTGGDRPFFPGPPAGIFVGETIRNGNFSPNALGRRIAADWGSGFTPRTGPRRSARLSRNAAKGGAGTSIPR